MKAMSIRVKLLSILITLFVFIVALVGFNFHTFDQLKGTGNALSGTAFRYVFMSAHMAVQNHGEELGAFFQRRVNLVTSAVGALNAYLANASQSIDIETEIVPFMIDSETDKVKTAAAPGCGGAGRECT